MSLASILCDRLEPLVHLSGMGSPLRSTSSPVSRTSSRTSDCAAASAEQLLESLLATEGVVGCFIADIDGIVGLQRLPGLIRQTPFFRRSKQVLKSYSAAEASLEGSTVRVPVTGGVLFFRRIESLYLCALCLTPQHSSSVVKALRYTADSMPGGLKMAPSIPPPPRYLAGHELTAGELRNVG